MGRTTNAQIEARLKEINSYLKGSGLKMRAHAVNGGWRIKMNKKGESGESNIGHRGTKGEIYNTLFSIRQTFDAKKYSKKK